MSAASNSIPVECLRARTSLSELLERWSKLPGDITSPLRRCAEQLASHMLPADELWWYDYGAMTGLAIVRDGMVVEFKHLLHALHTGGGSPTPRELVVHLPGARLTVQQLLVLRRFDPALANVPAQEVRAILEKATEWRLQPCREMGFDVESTAKLCREAGLAVEIVR